jgi:hypothetical protein
MPNNEQGFDLEKLKKDPQMWMRLAMPLDNSNVLENVFKDKENPFEKDSKAAMEKVQRLASEGKLYFRDFGRSRHFHKVEKDGEDLKLGDQHEIKLANRSTDPVLGALMWMSRGYFKWLGLERISNWFDKRLKRQNEIKALDKRYKEEYKSLSKEQKKELKALRKHEKNLKKLEKAQKDTEKTQQELDKIRGKDTGKTKGEMDAPLNQLPKIEPEKNTMQPTRLGDEPVGEQKSVRPTRTNELVQERTAEQEITGTKKEKAADKENSNQIILNGVEYSKENIQELPEIVRDAVQMIQQFIEQQKTIEREIQQLNQEQPTEVKENKQQPEQKIPNNAAQPTANIEGVKVEMPAPLNDPPKLEDEKVDIQGRPKEQEQPTLQERLVAEKQGMEAVKNWRDMLTASLFSHPESREMGDLVQSIKSDRTHYSTALSGVAFGVLTKNEGDQESKQHVMDALLNGQSLGSKNDQLINEGVNAYNHAAEQLNAGNREPMEKMLADAVRELSHQASQETSLSPRHVMITRLISNAFRIAQNNDLELPLSEEELKFAQGATELGRLSQNYHAARQYLGKEPMDMNSPAGRDAVCDLLAGNAVEKMMREDMKDAQGIPMTQIFMGIGLWCVDNIKTMVSSSVSRKVIGQDHVQSILEKPDGFRAACVSKDMVNEILAETMEAQKESKRTPEMQRENVQELQQPDINPLQIPG